MSDQPEPLDLVWGAKEIGALIGKNTQQTFYLLERGLIPARNIKMAGKGKANGWLRAANCWPSSKTRRAQHEGAPHQHRLGAGRRHRRRLRSPDNHLWERRMKRPSQTPDGRPAGGSPRFSFPLARFIEMIDPVAVGLQTLPDAQLTFEAEALVTRRLEADHHLAVDLMRWLIRRKSSAVPIPSSSSMANSTRRWADCSGRQMRPTGSSCATLG